MGVWIKHGALAASCAAALIGPAMAAAGDASRGEIAQQVIYKAWSLDDSDDEGWQMVAPLDATYTFELDSKSRLDLSARGAYIISENESPLSEGRVSTFSDTVVGATVSIDRFTDWQPFLTLDMNLPTGKETLKGTQKNAVMDPDLVPLVRFGEGFNLNFSVGVTYLVPDSKWAITGAVGYNWRGEYVADGDLDESYNPGDQLTALIRAQYLSDDIYGAISVQYFDEDISSLAGVPYFNPGNQIEINAEGTYVIDKVQSVSASLFYTTSGKNEYLDFFTNDLIKENVEGNGDYYFGQIAYSRILTAEIGGTVSATYGVRTENDYVPVDDLFLPARSYWDVRLSADYTSPDGWVIAADVGYGGVDDDGTSFAPDERSYQTFSAGLALSYAL
jgi:hypothetical protein